MNCALAERRCQHDEGRPAFSFSICAASGRSCRCCGSCGSFHGTRIHRSLDNRLDGFSTIAGVLRRRPSYLQVTQEDSVTSRLPRGRVYYIASLSLVLWITMSPDASAQLSQASAGAYVGALSDE